MGSRLKPTENAISSQRDARDDVFENHGSSRSALMATLRRLSATVRPTAHVRELASLKSDSLCSWKSWTVIGGSGRPTTSLLTDRGQTQLQVAAATGIANSTLSNVLHGKRQLTRDHIRRLAKHFNVDPGVFHG